MHHSHHTVMSSRLRVRASRGVVGRLPLPGVELSQEVSGQYGLTSTSFFDVHSALGAVGMHLWL
ncbi:uncharacterized protein B0H18DRAFT_1014886, partial [Fomitopsis serialis]|uniref:uncharacterized protein n=1 Tax=Fomitopsis serialis TaxID=139415 RepID=UPI0020086920